MSALYRLQELKYSYLWNKPLMRLKNYKKQRTPVLFFPRTILI